MENIIFIIIIIIAALVFPLLQNRKILKYLPSVTILISALALLKRGKKKEVKMEANAEAETKTNTNTSSSSETTIEISTGGVSEQPKKDEKEKSFADKTSIF